MDYIHFITKHRDRISTYLLAFIALTIPFSIKLGNLAIIISIVFNLFFFKKKNLKTKKGLKFWYLIAFFLITIVSALSSKNIEHGIRHLDLTLLLFLFAIIFLNSKVTKKSIFLVLNLLLFGTVISTLVLLIRVLIETNFNGSDFTEFVFHGFTNFYDQHPVYFSLYLSLSLFYLVLFSNDILFFVNKECYVICMAVLITGLIFCASKAVIGFNVVFFFLFSLKKIKSIRKRTLFVITFLLLSFFIYKIPFIENRFNKGLLLSETIINFHPTNDFVNKKLFSYEEKKRISDLEIRYLFLKIGLYHIYKDNKLFFGYGQGDTEDHLNYQYYSYNLGPNWLQNMNVHNQYLHILIMYGSIIFLFFFLYLAYSFFYAHTFKNQLHLYFLLLISFVFIFEVVLVRNKGIVFFYFFNSLFLFGYNDFKDSNLRH